MDVGIGTTWPRSSFYICFEFSALCLCSAAGSGRLAPRWLSHWDRVVGPDIGRVVGHCSGSVVKRVAWIYLNLLLHVGDPL
jgi:hypothetical protein